MTKWMRRKAVVCSLFALGWAGGCRSSSISEVTGPERAQGRTESIESPSQRSTSAAAAKLPRDLVAAELAPGVALGNPTIVQNVTLFPILSDKQDDMGPLTTLQAAIAAKTAEVREMDAAPVRSMNEVGFQGDGARVGTLVIENRGNVAIYVLAGTIVKGGKQDRQIGQDFIVEPRSVSEVNAFCVEHGRWTAERDGKATGGRFVADEQLATSEIRAAAQYAQDQGEVWSKVSQVNAKAGKSAPSGTLLATLDDAKVAADRDVLARALGAVVGRPELRPWIVGYAYAVDGRMKSARWFAHRNVFGLFRDVLLKTTAVDAITERGTAPLASPPKLAPSAVVDLVHHVDASERKQVRDTAANANEYSESAEAYGSKTRLKAAPKAARPVSEDYTAK